MPRRKKRRNSAEVLASAQAYLDAMDPDSVSRPQRLFMKRLLLAVQKIDEREQLRAEYANRLIAENMFAIVRMEISQITDQVINNAIAVKHHETGSGKAEFALNTTATLIMLAGNVLSGGGMSLLGNLLVASGEIVKAGAANDVAGVLMGTIHLSSASVAAFTDEGREKMDKQGDKGYQFTRTSTAQTAGTTTTTQTGSEGAANLINVVGGGVVDLGQLIYDRAKSGSDGGGAGRYEVKHRKTFFVGHGAGGTHAITCDVQEAMSEAYGLCLQEIQAELSQIGIKRSRSGILFKIMKNGMDPEGELHPMTEAVVKRGLRILSSSGGTHYQALTGGSGALGRSSVLVKSKRRVKAAYRYMRRHPEASADQVVAHCKHK